MEPVSQIKPARSPKLNVAIQLSTAHTPPEKLTTPAELRNPTASTSNPSKTGMVSRPADPSICPPQLSPSINGHIRSRGPSGSLDLALDAENHSPLVAGSAPETARSPSTSWNGRLHQRLATSPGPFLDDTRHRDHLGIMEQPSRSLQRVESSSGLSPEKNSATAEQATDHYEPLPGRVGIVGHDMAPAKPSLDPLDPSMSVGIGSHYELEGAMLQACRDMDSTRRGSSLLSVILAKHANILFSSPCKLVFSSY